MRGKKTAQLAYRLTEEEKAKISKISEELRMKPAEIVSLIMAQFVDARQQHGHHLIWPPEFNYFPASAQTVQEDADASSEPSQE